jgi:hypothetical protein
VIGLYTSYATPIFLRITSGRSRLTPGPFSLGKWYMPIGIIAVAWVTFIVVLLCFPASSSTTAQSMSEQTSFCYSEHLISLTSRLLRPNCWGCLSICRGLVDRLCKKVVHGTHQEYRVSGDSRDSRTGARMYCWLSEARPILMLTRKTLDRGKTRRHFFDFARVLIWSSLLPLNNLTYSVICYVLY